ncbi:MAG: hypothetical protein PHF64_00130 [Methanoregula sp.]|jgi:hypothetical protein|nr:hypothetical protein [Methanoregula sp.]
MVAKSEPRPDRAGLISPVAAGEVTSGDRIVVQGREKIKCRSDGHPCYYRVGRKGHEDVYWHPGIGYAIEHDWHDLEALHDLAGVVFFPEHADLVSIWSAVEESYGRLREAMDAELARIVDAYGERQAELDAEVDRCDQGKELVRAEAW